MYTDRRARGYARGLSRISATFKKVTVESSLLKFAIGGLVIDSGVLGIVGQGQLGMGIEGDNRMKGVGMFMAEVTVSISECFVTWTLGIFCRCLDG